MYFDRLHDVVAYERAPPTLQQVILDGLVLPGGGFAFRRNLFNLQVARLHGLPVPPLIDNESYKWPRHPSLTPYGAQKLTANFMALHPHCFVFNSMGSGKTYSSLWAADYIMRQARAGSCRALIVAPRSLLESVWAEAIFRLFLQGRTFALLRGDPKQRMAQLERDVDFYIINFDGLKVGARSSRRGFRLEGFCAALRDHPDIRIAIVDEASAFRNATSGRSRAAQQILGNRDYCWAMTGMPTPNAPTDAHGLKRLVDPNYRESFKSFQGRTMVKNPYSPFKWSPRDDGYEQARRLLQPAIRIPLELVWDAPAMVTQWRHVRLTKEQEDKLREFKKNLSVQLKGGTVITAINAAAYQTKFLQILMGAIYDEHHQWHSIDAEPRYKELLSVLEELDGKAVVFVPLTSVIEKLQRYLRPRYNVVVLKGGMSDASQLKAVKTFANDPTANPILCDPQTTAHGINDFVVARACVWFGLTQKHELLRQGIARVQRPGQKHPSVDVRIVSHPLEREFYERLDNKQDWQSSLLKAVEQDAV